MTTVVASLGLAVLLAAEAGAQWTVSYYQPYTTYYAPSTAYAYQTYYAPATTAYTAHYAPATTAYTSYYAPTTPVVATSGWYPGYWWDRIRTRLFPARTVVAAYPTTYAASYPSTYVASYPSTYVASYPTSYVASYAPAQQVTMRPVYTAAAAPCDACTTCAVPAVTQAGYVESSPTCCAASPVAAEPTPAASQPTQTFGSGSQQPYINPGETTPMNRSNTTQRPTEGAGNSGTPATGTSTGGEPAGGATENKSDDPLQKFLDEKDAYFRAPDLFNPNVNDKAVRHSPAPVNMAVYKRPAGSSKDRVTTQPITFEKAKRDAAGWKSASR
jgi:hypothetical protein